MIENKSNLEIGNPDRKMFGWEEFLAACIAIDGFVFVLWTITCGYRVIILVEPKQRTEEENVLKCNIQRRFRWTRLRFDYGRMCYNKNGTYGPNDVRKSWWEWNS